MNTDKQLTMPYDATFVKNQIMDYTPMHIANTEYLCDLYNEYMKNGIEPMTLELFEQLIYVKYFSLYLSQYNTIPNNKDLNEFINNTELRLNPNELIELFADIRKNKNNLNKVFFEIIEDKQHQYENNIE